MLRRSESYIFLIFSFSLSMAACGAEEKTKEKVDFTESVPLKFPGYCVETAYLDGDEAGIQKQTWAKSESGTWLVQTRSHESSEALGFNEISTFKYDDQDMLQQRELDLAQDQKIDAVFTYEYATAEQDDFDISNAPIGALKTIIGTKFDSDQIVTQTGYFYSEKGLLQRETSSSGSGEDTQITTSVLYLYDDKGHLIAHEIDSNGDGKVNSRYNFYYLELDQIGKVEIDSNNDGSIDSTELYSYDQSGNLLSIINEKAKSKKEYSFECLKKLVSEED